MALRPGWSVVGGRLNLDPVYDQACHSAELTEDVMDRLGSVLVIGEAPVALRVALLDQR
jgi:hypothetical protein